MLRLYALLKALPDRSHTDTRQTRRYRHVAVYRLRRVYPRLPKTDKLLKLTIDTGIDRRVIVSGIAEFYAPEEMLGKQICILANLKPRVIRGIESKDHYRY